MKRQINLGLAFIFFVSLFIFSCNKEYKNNVPSDCDRRKEIIRPISNGYELNIAHGRGKSIPRNEDLKLVVFAPDTTSYVVVGRVKRTAQKNILHFITEEKLGYKELGDAWQLYIMPTIADHLGCTGSIPPPAYCPFIYMECRGVLDCNGGSLEGDDCICIYV